MIIQGGNLVLQVQKDFLELSAYVQKNIGAIYKGTLLLWLTVYNAVRSCFGNGTWLSDKPWLGDDSWKNN